MLLNYSDKGQGPVLVLIHGLLGSLDNLNMVARSFNKTHRCISVDLPNHGQSYHHEKMDYPFIAEQVFQLLDHLGIENFNLLGHSMGGKAAMTMALYQPQRVNKLIVADIAPVTYPPRHQQIFAGLRAISLTEMTNRNDADATLSTYVSEAGVRQFLLRNLTKGSQGFQWKMNLTNIIANYDHVIGFPDLTGQFNAPSLFIKGSESDYVTAAHQKVVIDLFPKAKAKVIQGAGHWLHAEKTVIFNKIVKDFLAE
ncbi:alpha/beta fold hydrolase [Catenovulum sp. SM1970]|uniref:alpha/beta fold hydrolase n=1 Tax=Marinifaba aquimaris TaxID=2741323 RepID=UPI0015746A35|nr:alpha/beta fold hydrolase [Marinifaba aquimaris]NTS76045.1 alpha/beta fold hydrolase [Marinifaba aquimaris]